MRNGKVMKNKMGRKIKIKSKKKKKKKLAKRSRKAMFKNK